jgi:predicted  nucleic acid-binding Zn-ribbon protein
MNPEPTRLDDAVDLPAFRSSKDFPIAPKVEKAEALYPECHKALLDANEARAILKARMAKKQDVIAEIRVEIEMLEKDLTVEAKTRSRLHIINEDLIATLREMELLTEGLTETVEEAHRVQRTGLGRLIEKLKQLVVNWRGFKSRQLQAVASKAMPREDGESHG